MSKLFTLLLFVIICLFITTSTNVYGQQKITTVSIVPNASRLDYNAYQPNPIILSKGDTIVWTNEDLGIHTVTEKKALFDSGFMKTGETFKFTFNKTGTFNYICEIHPLSMFGTVLVNPSSQ